MSNTEPAVRPLPKSLHTITVIIRLAHRAYEQDTSTSPASCISEALNILGYDDAAVIYPTGHPIHDPHNIAYLALSKFRKDLGE